jgi:hypothetical protein
MFLQSLAQKPYVDIHNSSRLHIIGTSNINEFDCIYFFDNSFNNTYSFKVENDTNNAKLKIKNIKLSIPTIQFDCGNFLFNYDFQNTLKADSFPAIRLNISELTLVRTEKKYNSYVKAIFDIAGVERVKTIYYTSYYSVSENLYKLVGTIKVNIEDFDIEVSNKFFGSVKVNSEVEISFLLNFAPN